MLDKHFYRFIGKVIFFVNVPVEIIFQSVLQFSRLRKCVEMVAEYAYHKAPISVLRYAVVFRVHKAVVVLISQLFENFEPLRKIAYRSASDHLRHVFHK